MSTNTLQVQNICTFLFYLIFCCSLLNIKYANKIAITEHTGIEIPVLCFKKNERINAMINGTGTNFKSLMKYL